MRKTTYFEPFPDEGWPEPNDLRPYFLAPPGQEWTEGNDSWGLSAEGLYGTEGLAKFKEQVEVHLSMWGARGLGVLLFYHKYGGGYREMFTSKGDMSRLREIVPFFEAWKAVKEFIETDGELPKSIEWVANKVLPPNTFPKP